jgi:hypothetical protein
MGLEYFASIKRLHQVFEIARKGLRRYMYIRLDKLSIYWVIKILTLDELKQLVQITEKYLRWKQIWFIYVLNTHMLLNS